MITWNRIKPEDRVSYELYLDALRTSRNSYYNAPTQGEHIVAVAVCDLYRKQNKYNIFLRFDEEYRPFIKYGKISSFLSKSTIISLFYYMLIMVGGGISKMIGVDLNFLFYITAPILLIISLLSLLYYRDKYDIEKDKYRYEKSKPGWERKQKFKRLMDKIN